MRTIRDSIPMPTDETILQKIIPQGDIVKYLDGTYTDVRGYITKAPDAKQLITYDDIYRALGLNYDGSLFNPATDEYVGAIRFKPSDLSNIEIPYGPAMGGNVPDGPPFRGNGYTVGMDGYVIPEYKVAVGEFLKLYDGAELYTITREGLERLVAIYSEKAGKFIGLMD